MIGIRNYAIVTAAYWAFTVTDGALRLLVLLHFHELGYTPVQLAFLFLLYEFFGIVTNLVGGWLAARTGLRFTLVMGLVLQVVALGLLALLNREWSMAASVAYVMGCQALSGIAKDLTKMSAKSAIKVLVPTGDDSRLFKWVAFLTGSKNALKGAGFFVGGVLLSALGFRGALAAMAAGVFVVLVCVLSALPGSIGQAKAKPAFKGILSNSPGINRLSLARMMPGEFDRMPLNAGFAFAWPIDPGNALSTHTSTTNTPAAIAASAPRNPSVDSSTPPTKNPAPLSAFFDPVRKATHLNSLESSPVGTSTLIALLALIFVRSFAIPESAWHPI